MQFKFLYYIFFILPLLYLGSGLGFQIPRLIIILLLTCYIVSYKCYVLHKQNITLLLLLTIYIYFILHLQRYSAITALLFIVLFYFIFTFKGISEIVKIRCVRYFYKGMLFAGIIGFIYMYVTGINIVGGNYTENSWGISNLTIPVSLSLYIIFNLINTYKTKRKIISNTLFCIVLFLAIVFLGKRGPILFCLLSLFLVLMPFSSVVKKTILIILFLYPIYAIPLTEVIIQNFDETFGLIFQRSNDFESLEDNPRVQRLYAAKVFTEDFELVDLFGYHEELLLTKREDDTAHNHFHNLFLQLYYERGLLSIVCLLFLLFKYKIRTKCEFEADNMINFSSMLFLLLVGTNESILKSGTFGEIIFMIILLFNLRTHGRASHI